MMLAIDVAAIWLVNRRKTLLVWAVVMACAGAAALALASLFSGFFASRASTYQLWSNSSRQGVLGLLSESRFGMFRLWAYAIFLHGFLLLVGTAVAWRRIRPILAGAAAFGGIAVALVAADAFLIEPHWIEVSHRQIANSKIRHPVRIVVVADLQADRFGDYERSVLRQALAEKPDLILLAGDYLQAPWADQATLRADFHDFLRKIDFTAPLGVFAIQGNVDVSPSGWQAMFAGLGITTVDACRSFDLGELQLTCIGLVESFDRSLTIAGDRPDQFHLVLGHAPDYAMGTIDADLLLAGHTHGGQVRLPWFGPVITHSRVPHAWAAGRTELPGGRILLVSRGIGMERGRAPPMRFLCRPELMVIDLVAAGDNT